MVAFLYAACAALRLARFNSQVGQVDKRWFVGLASPAAAGLVPVFVWAVPCDLGWTGEELRYAALAVTVAAALLMVSRIRYCSFKGGGGEAATGCRSWRSWSCWWCWWRWRSTRPPCCCWRRACMRWRAGVLAVPQAAPATGGRGGTMTLPWTAEQCQWLRALGHPVLVHGALSMSGADGGHHDVGGRDVEGSRGVAGRRATAERAIQPLPTHRAPASDGGSAHATPAATIEGAGPGRHAPARPQSPVPDPGQPVAAPSPSAGLRTLHRALLRAAGQRTARAAEAVLSELGVDTAALRGDAAAKRALWPRLRTRRRQGSR